jgi:hypothetical protein
MYISADDATQFMRSTGSNATMTPPPISASNPADLLILEQLLSQFDPSIFD